MSLVVPFRIKICGVRLREDLLAAGKSPADAIGLNFFPASPRYVDPGHDSTHTLAALAGRLELHRVGVFVDASADHILRIADTLELDSVQLHGDEPLEVARGLIQSGLSVIRAIKLPAAEFDPSTIDRAVNDWLDGGAFLLLDADAGAAHGGGGQQLPWDVLRRWGEIKQGVQWALAGGLNPTNVTEAISRSGAASVDVASGVESSRGVKSAALIQAFAEAAGAALRQPPHL